MSGRKLCLRCRKADCICPPKGRPTKMSPEVRKKMAEATALDATVEEVCFFAGISKDTYYKWIKKDKELADEMTRLRHNPVLKARREVIRSFEEHPDLALKYLERKKKSEFAVRQEVTGADGEKLFTPTTEEKEEVRQKLNKVL